MKTLVISLKIFLFFTILTGVLYPLLVTGIAQSTFPSESNGSIIVENNKKIGSLLIGQQFDSVRYFTSRPSSIAYHPIPSGGSNYGLTNGRLKNLVAERRRHFIATNQLDSAATLPSEMFFASASGLDPHISPQAAFLQVNRIAKVRGFNDAQKHKLEQSIQTLTEPPQFLFLGEERINVLLLNLDTDRIK